MFKSSEKAKDEKEIRREVLCVEFWWMDMELRAGKGLVPNTKNSMIKARRRESVRGYGEAGSHPELKRV